MPNKFFPRKTNAKEYLRDLMEIKFSLDYTDQKVQNYALIYINNIKAITKVSRPHFVPSSEDFRRDRVEFAYHYKNFCYRVHSFREKLMQFTNAFLPLGFKDKELRIRDILRSPTVKSAGLLPVFEKFEKDKTLSNLIADREKLTHRLPYGNFDRYFMPSTLKTPKSKLEFFDWIKKWKREIILHAKMTNKSIWIIEELNHLYTKKLMKYKGKKN